MKPRIWIAATSLLILILTVPARSAIWGKRDLIYQVTVENHTDYGLLLLQFPAFKDESDRGVIKDYGMDPSAPGVFNPNSTFIKFNGYEKDIPDSVTVHWQLVRLSQCASEIKLRSRVKGDADPKLYTQAHGCKREPIADKIFRKTIDLSQYRKTTAYMESGSKHSSFEKKTLVIVFDFRGEELYVRVKQGATGFK